MGKSSDRILSLPDLLYTITLANGSKLFLPIMQLPNGGDPTCPTPNMPEAETLLEKINVQSAAWCDNYFADKYPRSFLTNVIGQCFDSDLVSAIKECTCDKEKKIVSTTEEQDEDNALDQLESEAWFENVPGEDSSPQNAKNTSAQSMPFRSMMIFPSRLSMTSLLTPPPVYGPMPPPKKHQCFTSARKAPSTPIHPQLAERR